MGKGEQVSLAKRWAHSREPPGVKGQGSVLGVEARGGGDTRRWKT